MERKAYPAYAGKYELFPGTVAEINTDGRKLCMKAAPLGPEAPSFSVAAGDIDCSLF